MNTINEMGSAWYMWVNGNYDILIMTITLIVVAGLVLEVVRLKKSINTQVVDLWNDSAELWGANESLKLVNEDQVRVNVRLAEDIAELQKRLTELKLKRKVVKK